MLNNQNDFAEAVKVPQPVKPELKIMSHEEIAKFLDTVKNYRFDNYSNPLFAAFCLVLSTGIRRGKLLGLHWREVDFAEKRILIKTQLVERKNGLYFSELNTMASKRTIFLADTVIEVLREHQKQQDETKLKLGEAYRDDGLVFCTDTGKPIHPRNFNRHFKILLDKAGLNHYRFDDLRKTFTMFAFKNGISQNVLQEILGYSNFTKPREPHVTLAVYQKAMAIIAKTLTAFQNKNNF